jgi:ditrans,polycis-polyprenyl diphosphate synthase
VTVYAFAIENFKRPPDEVDALMDLCKEKLTELCEQGWVMPVTANQAIFRRS